MKSFKLMLIMISVTFGFVAQAMAQGQTKGLYLTFKDYLNHKLSYTQDQGDKLYLHEFLGRKVITVVTGDKKLTLQKDQVFGYHDASGHDYRFFGNVAYQVVDTSGFVLYSFDKLVQQGKGPKPVRSLYFSTKADAEILPLTEGSLEKAFVKNHKFRYMVAAEFRSDEDLALYDNSLNEYKIKEVYSESSK